jgi:hypothetical protein
VAVEAITNPITDHTVVPRVKSQCDASGVVNGGIVSTILDCHSNMLAAYAAMKASDGGGGRSRVANRSIFFQRRRQ